MTALAPLLAVALAAAPTPPRGAAPVAFLGLRPTQDRTFQATALERLTDAQRLRAVAENVVEMLSGAPVQRHDELRSVLGKAYLVDLFECRADAACQLRIALPLRRAGVASALVGDVYTDGAKVRVRLRRFDLQRGRLAEEVNFTAAAAEAEALAPWRAALQPLFVDTGVIALVTNVPGAACTLDGRPCATGADGVITGVAEGEHLLELSAEGHRRATRVVSVARGERLRVAVALEELPLQAQKAPDPAARVPTFAAPGDAAQLTPFGSLRLALMADDVDAGDREDPSVPAGVRPRDPTLVVLPRPALLGVTVQAPRRESGWELRGAVAAAWVKEGAPELDSAYAEIVKEDLGFRVMLGLGPGIVSSLTAGTLSLPEGFGDLAAGFVGVTASQSLGPVVLEAFVGKHKDQLTVDAAPDDTSPVPFGAVHVAYVNPRRMGRLYGEEFPLTVGVSGLYGEERLGTADEQAWAAEAGLAVAPRREQSAVWVASAELFLPLGRRVSLAGEAWTGEGVHRLDGAVWQVPRIVAATGRHRPLRSAGGWAQLDLALGEALEVRLVGGVDAAVSGLGSGLAPFGEPAVRRNGLVAVNATLYLLEQLSLGVQVHAVRTEFQDPALGSPTLRALVLASQLTF